MLPDIARDRRIFAHAILKTNDKAFQTGSVPCASLGHIQELYQGYSTSCYLQRRYAPTMSELRVPITWPNCSMEYKFMPRSGGQACLGICADPQLVLDKLMSMGDQEKVRLDKAEDSGLFTELELGRMSTEEPKQVEDTVRTTEDGDDPRCGVDRRDRDDG